MYLDAIRKPFRVDSEPSRSSELLATVSVTTLLIPTPTTPTGFRPLHAHWRPCKRALQRFHPHHPHTRVRYDEGGWHGSFDHRGRLWYRSTPCSHVSAARLQQDYGACKGLQTFWNVFKGKLSSDIALLRLERLGEHLATRACCSLFAGGGSGHRWCAANGTSEQDK